MVFVFSPEETSKQRKKQVSPILRGSHFGLAFQLDAEFLSIAAVWKAILIYPKLEKGEQFSGFTFKSIIWLYELKSFCFALTIKFLQLNKVLFF